MATLSTVVFLFAYAAMAVAVLPENYVLQVTPECGKGIENDAEILIATDLVINAQAECANGATADFTPIDDTNVNWKLAVSYPGNGNEPCVFMKKTNTLVFHVKVVVAYGEKPGLVHMHEEEWTVTCAFSKHGVDDSEEQSIVEGLIAPSELLTNVGPDSKSTFDLQLVNILAEDLPEENIHLGRIVKLMGESKAEGGEGGIKPINCVAMDGETSYAVLRGGCGDGIIFPKDQGFITDGTTTLSPPFELFSINFSPVIQFKCVFVTCDDNCDGSSCLKERRTRRSAPIHHHLSADSIISRSDTIRFAGEQLSRNDNNV